MNSFEYDLSDLQNYDTLTKLRALELLLNNLKRKEILSLPNKRDISKKRAKDSKKKQPGWELAFGKRKRSLERLPNSNN